MAADAEQRAVETAPQAAESKRTDGTEDNTEDNVGEALAQLHARLQRDELTAFDPVGASHIARLLDRAASLGGPATEHLLHRAELALGQLQDQHAVARQRAERAVARLAANELDPHGWAQRALDRGDLSTVHRLSRRLPQTSIRLRDQVRKHWEAALDAEVEKRGLSCPGTLEAPSPAAIHRAATLDKAIALYRDAMAAATAELAVARAVKAIPPQAGRYHAGSVATRALRAMQGVPPYLRAQLARTEMLGLLQGYGQSALRADQKPTKKRGARRRPRATSGTRPQQGKTAGPRRRRTGS